MGGRYTQKEAGKKLKIGSKQERIFLVGRWENQNYSRRQTKKGLMWGEENQKKEWGGKEHIGKKKQSREKKLEIKK